MVPAIAQNILVILSFYVASTIAFHLQSRASYSVKDSHSIPRRWTRVGPASAQHVVQLQIGLRQSNFSELERHLYEVSDPNHPRYGQHLSSSEVNQLVMPTNKTLHQVHEWLLNNSVNADQIKYSLPKDWIKVTLPLSSAEHLLDTKYSIFKHEDGTHLVRTLDWSLPRHLHEHIDTIQPTNSFFRTQPQRSMTMVSSVGADFKHSQTSRVSTNTDPTLSEICNATSVTSYCLRKLYGTLHYEVQSSDSNTMGLANFLGETCNRSDVSIFLQNFRPEAIAAANTFKVQVIADGNDQQTPNNSTQLKDGKNVEGNLDAETMIGIAWPTPLIAYNTGGSPEFLPDALTVNNTNEPYLTWLQFLLAEPNVPQVISVSYGDDEQSVPYSYATAVCNAFAQLGARGVSVLFASGDSGVGRDGYCISNDGKNTRTFLPTFPASCPYVTVVGGTRNISPEIVAHDSRNNYTGGGGFSNYFARPSYQDSVVPAYVSSLNGQLKGLFNASGRAYPDISAQAYHYLTIWNGSITVIDGTSAATPTAASIISLANDALIAAGKPVLGFLNPWLYSTGYKSFTDITQGSAMGCNTTGFPAQRGWDAASGFGTPNFPQIRAATSNSICISVNVQALSATAALLAMVLVA